MVDYILPTLIFISCLTTLWVHIKSNSRFIGFVSFITSALIAFVIKEVAKSSPDYTLLILSFSLVVLVGVLILSIWIKKHELDVKATTGLYSVMMIIGFFLAKSCHNDDVEQLAKQDKINSEITNYKSLYDFNVDSLAYYKSQQNSGSKDVGKLGHPILIYRKLDNGKLNFDYEINKLLNEELKSFSLDSIKNIVILENSSISVGEYSNGRTTAEQIKVDITFVDINPFKEITTTSVLGGSPPQSISYRRGAPDSRSGSYPSNSEILGEISRILKL